MRSDISRKMNNETKVTEWILFRVDDRMRLLCRDGHGEIWLIKFALLLKIYLTDSIIKFVSEKTYQLEYK